MTRRTRRKLADVARYTILGLWLVVVLFPLFWSVMTSLKPPYEWFTWPPTWIPNPFTLNNYRVAWFGEEPVDERRVRDAHSAGGPQR